MKPVMTCIENKIVIYLIVKLSIYLLSSLFKVSKWIFNFFIELNLIYHPCHYLSGACFIYLVSD